MKIITKIVLFFAGIIFSLLYPSVVHAEMIEMPYLVSGQIHPTQSMMRNLARMFFVQTVSFEYDSGKVMLSFDKQGTGNIYVGDTIYINSLTTGQSYTYKASDERCVTNEFNSVITPIDITNLVTPGINNLQIRFDDRCGMLRPMGQIYLVNIDKAEPEPFLRLPWDFEEKGLSFTEAALSMTSFFDHEYPLLSSALKEPIETTTSIKKFDSSQRTDEPYSSHDGYDYARKGQALLGEPVLAAAAGWAKYVNSCKACGNMIVIDHEQGYQTQYLHLQKNGLIETFPGHKVWVREGQIIGKIGATGNVYPSGDLGAHLHFGIVQDKNHDGDFTDNIPDGMTDPFGWKIKDGLQDPWAQYSFLQNGVQKHGNKSHYLWKIPLASTKSIISPDGGQVSSDIFSIEFDKSTVDEPMFVEIKPTMAQFLPLTMDILGYAIEITAKNFIDSAITEFRDFFDLKMVLNPALRAEYKSDTFALYTSTNGVMWVKDPAPVYLTDNSLYAKVNHLSYFAFAAEKKDSPEIELSYDPTTFELKIKTMSQPNTTSITRSSLSKNGKLQKVEISSYDSPPLSFIIKEDKRSFFNQMYMRSLPYSMQSEQKLAHHSFIAKTVNEKNSHYKKLIQIFEIPEELKVKLEYSYVKDKTIAHVERGAQSTLKESFEGLRLLKINTDKGNLRYTF